MTLALVVGTLLAIGALGFVLYPIFAGAPLTRPASATRADTAPSEDPILALREIEFDRETGKLSESDYVALKTTYSRRAIEQMRREKTQVEPQVEPQAEVHAAATETAVASPAVAALDPVERAVMRMRKRRACVSCGPRPEKDAVYCSHCGRFLEETCPRCGVDVAQPGARYCSSCGDSLAA